MIRLRGLRKTVTDRPIFVSYIHSCVEVSSIRYSALSRLQKCDNQQCLLACKFWLKCPYLLRKMSHNWHNYNKKLKFSDAKNTRETDAFFSEQKSSETWELEVDEQSENRQLSSYTVIDFVEQSESRPSASISSAKNHITHVSGSEI